MHAADQTRPRSGDAPGRSEAPSRSKTPPPNSTGRTCNALVVIHNGDVTFALKKLKKLKKMLGTSGTTTAMRRHEEYLKPSVRTRMKATKARRRERKNAARRAWKEMISNPDSL